MCFTGGQDNSVHMHNSGGNVGNDKSHKNFVNCVRASPDGKKMVSVSTDCGIGMWGIEDVNCVPTVKDKAHAGTIYCAEWFPDSERFVTCSADKTVKVWNYSSGACLAELKVSEKPTLNDMQVGVSCSDSVIVSLSLSGQFNVWNVVDIADGKFPDRVLNFHTSPVSHVFGSSCTPTGYSVEKSGRVLEHCGSGEVKAYNFGKTVTGAHFTASDNSDILYLASYTQLYKANFETGTLDSVCTLASSGVAMTNDGSDLFVGGGKGGVTKITNGQVVKREVVSANDKPVSGLVVTKSRELVASDESGAVNWLDRESLALKRTYNGEHKFTALACSDDYVAVGDGSGEIHILKAEDGTVIIFFLPIKICLAGQEVEVWWNNDHMLRV